MRKLFRFIKLQIVLWHSDKWTNWDRLRMRYAPEPIDECGGGDYPYNPESIDSP